MVAATVAMSARAVCAAVLDPELPVITIGDLGIVRSVVQAASGRVEVVLTPTYSGCPATEVIRADVITALHQAGFHDVDVRLIRAPAWTTDWITDNGRRVLAEHGIAPPSALASSPGHAVVVELSVRCPLCGSAQTELVSRFGATACQAMYRCLSCREPFDHVKAY